MAMANTTYSCIFISTRYFYTESSSVKDDNYGFNNEGHVVEKGKIPEIIVKYVLGLYHMSLEERLGFIIGIQRW